MSSYSLKILDPRKITNNEIKESNYLYETWEKVFSQVVEKAGGVLDPDDYFRNQFALVIYDDAKILGFSLCTEFDLRLTSARNHHYWRSLKEEIPEKLVQQGLNRVMSMEYLTVLPAWRKNESNIPWAEVIVGLGLLYQDSFPLDAMIGTPRVDLKMDQTCMRMGGVPIQEPIAKMNYPCAVQVFSKVQMGKRRFENFITQRWTSELWKKREDFRVVEEITKKNKTTAV